MFRKESCPNPNDRIRSRARAPQNDKGPAVWLSAGRYGTLPLVDAMACQAIRRRLEGTQAEPDQSPLEALGDPEDGIDFPAWARPCLGANDFPLAMRPQRSQVLTLLAVRAFFGSIFSDDPTDRERAARYLSSVMSRELEDIRYTRR